MAIGAIANVLEDKFSVYLDTLHEYLMLGLQNHEDSEVCKIAVGVVGDICRAVEGKIIIYCNDIVQTLLINLSAPYLARSVKPPVISAFSDIALAIGDDFEPYLEVVMNYLNQAASTEVDQVYEKKS